MAAPVPSQLTVRTPDGVQLSIQRLTPEGGATRGAVVLQHGLGSNGLVFVLPGRSLAEHLCRLGYDCFVPDLRGTGRSELPARPFTLDDYLERDIPTILSAALEASGTRTLQWVGHSMGGILMWMYGMEHPDAPVKRLVTVGSALDYRPGRSVYRSLYRLLPILGFLPSVPFGLLSRLHAPLAGWGPLLMTEGMNFYRSNIEREMCCAVMRGGFSPIPMTLLRGLATTFSEGGFSRSGGQIAYLERAAAFRIPNLIVGGSRDPQCPVEATLHTAALLSGVPDKQVLLVGKPYGQIDDYGHFDLLVGRHAQSEVWPHITRFLSCADSPGAAKDRMVAG